MQRIANLIKTKCPNYAAVANCAFNKDYSHLWDKNMYQSNQVFTTLKQQYGNMPLKRQLIIDLFRSGNYYDGFLCAMVWGGIGANPIGTKIFNSVFDTANKNAICANINNVVTLLQNGNTQQAYCSLLPKGSNHIYGVGESFYTKLLYFASAGINPNLKPQPLIFDSVMHEVYDKILSIIGQQPQRLGNDKHYLDYCDKMEDLRQLLNLPTAGHVEALLFGRCFM